jgi:hypothetical protein
MYLNLILHSYDHSCIASRMYSGPLTQRMTSGLLRHEAIGMEVDFSMPSDRVVQGLKQIICRLQSSMTFNNLNVLPPNNWSCMKYIEHMLTTSASRKNAIGLFDDINLIS